MTPRNRRGTGRAPAQPFFARVKQELIRQRRSQRSVLEAAQVPPSTFHLLETAPPRDLATRVNTVLRIAAVLHIDEDEALQLAGLPSTEPAEDEPAAATPDEAIDRLYAVDRRLLDDEQKRLIEDTIRSFVRLNERELKRGGDAGPDRTG